jgi:hypothetical protein
MRKPILTALSVAIAIVIVLGCDEDDDDGNGFEIGETCEGVGGFCTTERSSICPAKSEPYSSSGDQGLDCGGHCCVPAPGTHCNNESGMNCVPGNECPMFWKAVQGEAVCEEGRVCCFWSG